MRGFFERVGIVFAYPMVALLLIVQLTFISVFINPWFDKNVLLAQSTHSLTMVCTLFTLITCALVHCTSVDVGYDAYHELAKPTSKKTLLALMSPWYVFVLFAVCFALVVSLLISPVVWLLTGKWILSEAFDWLLYGS